MFFNKVKKVLKNPSLINKKVYSLLNKNLKKPNKVFTKSFSIDDQIKNGITGAWNLGLNEAYKNDCDILINCNDDLWFCNNENYYF